MKSDRENAAGKGGRDESIDSLRGFLIFLVAVGHFPADQFLSAIPSWWTRLNESLYLFHVAVFLAITALYPPKASVAGVLRSVAAALLPYVVWMGVFRYGQLVSNPMSFLSMLAGGNFAALCSILWFLPALACVRVLSSALPWLEKSPGRLAATLGAWLVFFSFKDLVIAQHNAIPFGLDVAVLLLPVLLAFRATSRLAKTHLDFGTLAAWLLFLGLDFYLYSIEPLKTHTPWHKKIDLAQFSVPASLENYVVWTALCCSTLFLFRKRSFAVLSFLGRHSLTIFLLHYEVFKFFMEDPGRKPPRGYLTAGAIFVLSLGLPALLSWALRKLVAGVRWVGL